MRSIVDDELISGTCWVADIEHHYKASAADIWPWLAQMGKNSAGWYSYDWIDNLGRPSLNYIDPERQAVKTGQPVSIFTVANFEKDKFITLSIGDRCNMTWLLVPSENGCALFTRLRVRGPKTFLTFTLGPAHNFMQQKQFLELEKRLSSQQSKN